MIVTLSLVTAVACHGYSSGRTYASRPPLPTPASLDEPSIRVRLDRVLDALSITSDAPVSLVRPDGRVERLSAPLRGRIEPAGLILTDTRGMAHAVSPNTEVELIAAGGRLGYGLVRAPGAIRLSVSRAGVDVIEIVPMEDYVAGVIAKELYPHWHPTAFEVQAVCARTYALHEQQRALRAGRAYDVVASTLDQAYSGTTTLDRAVAGARNTRGVVLTSGGSLIRAYYSSTCGGRAASAADVWPTGPGYEFNLAAPLQASLREHFCQNSPRYRWQVMRDRTTLSARLRAWGASQEHPIRALREIVSITPTATNAVGRPTTYAVTDTARQRYTLGAEDLRVACNAGAAGLPEITSETRLPSGDVEADVLRGKVVFSGRGFGHGVGMCQFCTQRLAEMGLGWREIVLRVYPGAELERVY